MTLFETLFYYYTLFDESDDYVSMRKGIQELLDDAECLKSLQHSVEIFWYFMSELGVSGGSMAICPIDQHNSVRKQDEEQTENILRTQKRK